MQYLIGIQGEVIMRKFKEHREFMKSLFAEMKEIVSDQKAGKPMPALQKTPECDHKTIALIKPGQINLEDQPLTEIIKKRRSRRKYKEIPLTFAELSYLLYVTQGVQRVVKNNDKPYVTMRTVPSAGARHPFETYLVIFNVESLKPGIYRYLPIEHKLEIVSLEMEVSELKQKVVDMTLGQTFAAECGALFIWSCVPYRAEWRYDISSHKAMLLDAGHICQNLYLACENIDAGACAIAAYDQKKTDKFVGLDGDNEFTVYLSPAGKVR